MATAPSNPTVRRLELAARLRDLRLAAGRSMEEVAAELMCSTAKISRLETGERGIQPRDVRDLCRFYDVEEEERDRLIRLAEESRKPGWWQDYRTLDQRAATFVALESEATEIRFAQGLIIPGLLQTHEYARALVSALRPPGGMGQEQVDDIVRLRAQRQNRLLRGEIHFATVVDEAAFQRVVGSAAVMRGQMERLIDLVQMSCVTFQVIPFRAGAHPLLEGSFQHLRLAARLPDVVHVEGLLGTFIIDDPVQVQAYWEIYGHLSKNLALGREASLDWLSTERDRWGVIESAS